MAKSIDPVQFLQFGGVVTSGHPLRRPPNSAALCNNLRVMPGGYLRLRGGRIIRYDATTGSYLQFHQFQRADGTGNIECIAQYSGAARKWQRFTPGATFSPTDLETIDITHGITGTLQAATNVRNRCFLYNGLGVIGGAVSKPALSSWDGSQLRYVGLDCYTSTGANPTAAYAVGAGNNAFSGASRAFYVGLYNSATGHLSNALYAGTVGTAGTSGTVTISNLTRLTKTSHNAGELAELFYVFYATPEGGQTAYLIMDSTGVAPAKTAVANTSMSLSITATVTAGFILDQTQERPTENFPPKPMSHVTFANGRVYGISMPGGVGTPQIQLIGSNTEVTSPGYAYATRESPRAVWSAAADDAQSQDFVGLPEESWPSRNSKYTPTGEPPLYCAKGPNETNVIYFTKNGTFLLEETADGLHEWTTISSTEGIGKPESYAQTPYGSVWITQNAQLVLLRPGAPQLKILSTDFQALIPNGTVGVPVSPTSADYIASPSHQIDRYQVWLSDGSSLVYDFFLGGVAYTHSSQSFTGAKTISDANGLRYHIVGGTRYIWTHEVDPLNDLVPAMDQTAASTWAEVNGDYIGQWMDFGDNSLRKEMNEFGVTGDCATSAVLGAPAAILRVYADLASDAQTVTLVKTAQDIAGLSNNDRAYQGKIASPHRFWLKPRISLYGHAADWYGDPNVPQQRYFPAPSTTGDLAPSVDGCIWQARVTVYGQGGNRT